MIYKLFTGVINKGLTASVVIVAVLLARLFLGRLPKKYSYFLWIIVGIRLICPFGISSSLSVFNLIGGAMVWLFFLGMLFAWNLFLWMQMRRRTSAAIRLEGRTYECGEIPSPFVMGIFSPRIYLIF